MRQPWDDGEHSLSVGLAPVAPEDWLAPDDDTALLAANKQALDAAVTDGVYARLPGTDDAIGEMRYLLAAHVGRPAPEGDALRAAAQLVPDDLCVLDRRNGAWVLVAGSLHAAGGWRLGEKLGLPLPGIHAPVPGYDDQLALRVDRIFDRLQPGPILARANWTLHDDATLYLPFGHHGWPADLTAETALTRIYTRTEHQTLRKLPRSGAVMFTIRTSVRPLGFWSAPSRRALAAALRSMHPAIQGYKRIAPLLPVIEAVADACP